LEALGQSQVPANLEEMAPAHRITLAAFEKPAYLARTAAMAAMRTRCDGVGLPWIARRCDQLCRRSGALRPGTPDKGNGNN
jgi:hypothetical protein